uniref:Uncharacterized protein n=1 Tax=Noctiluca scintillans TaxID=2966 RepID=A0A7S1A1D9_NOCSC|mmetsp:Transcript_27093/g.71276  ORF Transcript_27093/g.71276 Transcript_27093/m.71276 type:complete len:116 (+) Transcript_27093:68-415(+)
MVGKCKFLCLHQSGDQHTANRPAHLHCIWKSVRLMIFAILGRTLSKAHFAEKRKPMLCVMVPEAALEENARNFVLLASTAGFSTEHGQTEWASGCHRSTAPHREGHGKSNAKPTT